jgi:cytochrome c oxidase subunit 2
VVLGILAVAQLARVYELTSRLRGKREEDISVSDNRMNATLFWLFPIAYFGFFLWLIFRYKDHMLPVAASEQGVQTDWLLNFNWIILFAVFFLTNALLFYFAGKYVYSKDRKAHWYPHNNKLELLWTVVPAGVLAVIIIYGLTTWNRITSVADADAVQVELYAKQFDWTVRYPGTDGMLGATDYRLINGENPLGIVTAKAIAVRLAEIDADIAGERKQLAESVLPDSKVAELEHHISYLERMASRIVNLRTLMEEDIKANGPASAYLHGSDDVVTKDFYLPVHKQAKLLIRSRDIIHSAYMPHLRIQMNAVPGMTTTMKVVPTITTDSMRTHVMKDDKFDFVLLCNKICGASHYNMQLPLTVVPGADFDAFVAEANKKPFEAPEAPAAPATPADTVAVAQTNTVKQ